MVASGGVPARSAGRFVLFWVIVLGRRLGGDFHPPLARSGNGLARHAAAAPAAVQPAALGVLDARVGQKYD
jgi:hypothetical protein